MHSFLSSSFDNSSRRSARTNRCAYREDEVHVNERLCTAKMTLLDVVEAFADQ